MAVGPLAPDAGPFDLTIVDVGLDVHQALSSRPEDSHLRALPDPYVNLSIHTAPDVRPFPWPSRQWAKSVGFARRSRSNQSRAPLVLRRNRLNLRRAQRMT